MDTSELAQEALACYDRLLAADPRLRPRPGQRQMAELVAQAFAQADLAQPAGSGAEALPGTEPRRAIAVIQAGTGVGKSLAYCAPALALALARNTRVLISTATVALQEQLVHKDLPALAAQFDPPLRFALAKGRGRYLCQLKLERRLAQLGAPPQPGGTAPLDPQEDDWFADAPPLSLGAGQDELGSLSALHAERASGRWDGDYDTLAMAPDPALWQAVAAQASSCSARHCPAYERCSYFEQRKQLVGAQVIVVNHDLLLSTLGSRTLPDLDASLLVIDEAHHLPAAALEQFASRMDLSRLGWIERLTQRALKIGTALQLEEMAEMAQHEAPLRRSMQELARLVLQHYGAELGSAAPAAKHQPVARVEQGRLPTALIEPLASVLHSAGVYVDALRALSKALRNQMRDAPAQSHRLAHQYAELGSLAPRLEAVHETARLLLQRDAAGPEPVAKWFAWEARSTHERSGEARLEEIGRASCRERV